MRLDVSKALVAEGNAIPFSVDVRLPDIEMFRETIAFPDAAKLTGTYTYMGDVIEVKACMAFTAHAHCSWCLTPVTQDFETPIEAAYSLAPDPENPDLYLYDGAWIDPSDMAADAACLAMPMQWRCCAGCKGLCPVCGTDRNHTLCSCRSEGTYQHPFAALKPLLNEDESEV